MSNIAEMSVYLLKQGKKGRKELQIRNLRRLTNYSIRHGSRAKRSELQEHLAQGRPAYVQERLRGDK